MALEGVLPVPDEQMGQVPLLSSQNLGFPIHLLGPKRISNIAELRVDAYEIRENSDGSGKGSGGGSDDGAGGSDGDGDEDGDEDGKDGGEDAQSRKWADKIIAWKSFTPIGLLEGTAPLALTSG